LSSLSVLLDVFTRAIRGWELSGSLSEELTKAALQRALAYTHPEIHHSDQGVQYAAHGYVQLLQGTQVQISMAAKGTPTDNAYVERFMRTLKEEEVYVRTVQPKLVSERGDGWQGRNLDN
jgi:putative transposase